ncbi:MAG: LacI family DNA-binding transcriptional regulator, partial [Spirochaetales bacterium]|nr:LacI family DNA-binding transcriptional regulator [Spirochaetales bacterium]
EAGVSVTTASYSLNGGGRISEQTRQKVLQAAERVGYIPSVSARALKGQNARAVGIFVDGVAGPVYGQIIEGAQERFKSEGWGLIVGTLNSSVQELAVSLVRDSLLAGSIVMNGGLLTRAAVGFLLEKTPFIVLDIERNFLEKAPGTSRICRIEIDNRKGMEALFNEIKRKKRSRIVFLEGPSSSWDFRTRKELFFDLCKRNGFREPKVLSCDYKAHGAYRLVKDTFAAQQNYDAIVAANDEMALGALKALKETGLRIPEDIVVTGFDDIEAALWVDPPLTTIRVDYKGLGAVIAEKMLQLLSSTTPVRENILFPADFVGRQSSG